MQFDYAWQQLCYFETWVVVVVVVYIYAFEHLDKANPSQNSIFRYMWIGKRQYISFQTIAKRKALFSTIEIAEE